MSEDWETFYRHCMEVAVGLLRQGQDTAAMDILSDALNGVFHPAASVDEDAPLELAIEDETPEIPAFQVNAAGELEIDDAGWFIPPEFVETLSMVPWSGASPGPAIWEAEGKVRELLTAAVKVGRVRKL